MLWQLDDLDEPVAREAGKPEPGIHHLLQIAVVEFIAMPVALADDIGAVHRMRERAVRNPHFLRAQAHGATEVRAFVARFHRPLLVLPLRDQRDDRVRTRTVELRAVCALEPDHVPRILDDRELHAETDTEIGDPVLARETDGLDLAIDAALAEPAGHEDRVGAVERVRAVLLEVLRLDEIDLDPRARAQPGVHQRFGQRDV
jgi:hypothetical protein